MSTVSVSVSIVFCWGKLIYGSLECWFALSRNLKYRIPRKSADKLLEILREFRDATEYQSRYLIVSLQISNNWLEKLDFFLKRLLLLLTRT